MYRVFLEYMNPMIVLGLAFGYDVNSMPVGVTTQPPTMVV